MVTSSHFVWRKLQQISKAFRCYLHVWGLAIVSLSIKNVVRKWNFNKSLQLCDKMLISAHRKETGSNEGRQQSKVNREENLETPKAITGEWSGHERQISTDMHTRSGPQKQKATWDPTAPVRDTSPCPDPQDCCRRASAPQNLLYIYGVSR